MRRIHIFIMDMHTMRVHLTLWYLDVCGYQ